jgi:NADH:ubiquinone oxidoreductase subunit 3 (subunit A)
MNTDIHRLLDDAFAGVEMTPDAQDLKEEVRANLVARVDELEASGVAPADAARRAIGELGDVRVLLGEAETDAAPAARPSPQDAYLRHRVRPKPGFVVRTVVWSIAAVVGITLGILGATGVLPLPIGPVIGLFGVASTAIALLVGDSLSQETTTNHPMPQNRAGGYFLATFLAAYGLSFAGLVALQALPVWAVVFAALGVIAAIILFAFLGATQTNRHKAWVRHAHASVEPSNRFEEEPETAARFGIYTAVIWFVTFAVIVVLVFTVGWWWAPVAFVAGFAAMMLLLARMMFGPRKTS